MTVTAPDVDLDHLISALNTEQRAAVLHATGPLLVFAGAGSGKTRVLTARIAHLVMARGVAPTSITAVTFTNKAAREMKDRLATLLSPEAAKAVAASTFHAACLRMLRPHARYLQLRRDFSIYDEDDTKRVAKNAVEDAGFDPKVIAPPVCRSRISTWKNHLWSSERALANAIEPADVVAARVYVAYERLLREASAVDFDDLLLLGVRLLEDQPAVLADIRTRTRHLLVDEYQDTNTAQSRLVELLAGPERNVCVVGDADQSIYGFRGAEMSHILGFEDRFPGARRIVLERNYRSTQAILDAANAVIEHNVVRPPKRLFTTTKGTARVASEGFGTADGEAAWIATEIANLRRQKVPCSDIAVLCRLRVIGQAIERALLTAEIPCKLVGGTAFLARAHIRDALAYARLVANPDDEAAFRRVVNIPRRGVGDASVRKIRAWCRAAELRLGEGLTHVADMELPPKARAGIEAFNEALDGARRAAEAGQPPAALMERLLNGVGYREDLAAIHPDTVRFKDDDLDALIEMARRHPNLPTFLEHIALASDSDDIEANGRVLVMTVHAAKGLEWPVVFVPAMEEGVFPDGRATSMAAVEEERRLAYVAITRARERLFLSHARRRLLWGRVLEGGPSRFLAEMSEAPAPAPGPVGRHLRGTRT